MTSVLSCLVATMALAADPGPLGLPFGIPPAADDPVIAHVAPPQCLFYVDWAGTAAPRPGSSSETEKLLAEPEVQAFFSGLGKAIAGYLRKQDEEAKAAAINPFFAPATTAMPAERAYVPSGTAPPATYAPTVPAPVPATTVPTTPPPAPVPGKYEFKLEPPVNPASTPPTLGPAPGTTANPSSPPLPVAMPSTQYSVPSTQSLAAIPAPAPGATSDGGLKPTLQPPPTWDPYAPPPATAAPALPPNAAAPTVVRTAVAVAPPRPRVPEKPKFSIPAEDYADWLNILLTHPTAIFLEDVKVTLAKPVEKKADKKNASDKKPDVGVIEVSTAWEVEIRAGMVVSLGPDSTRLF